MSASPHTAVMSSGITLHSVSRSHVGRVRTINEDRVFDRPEMGCWAVADGMGGHRGGDIAAQTVVDCLRSLPRHGQLAPEDMIGALDRANETIYRTNLELGGQAGTTVVAAVLKQTQMSIAWAGDSRAYLIRNGAVSLLTRDHSFVQELIDAGLLSPIDAGGHPKSNIVTRALGVNSSAILDRIDIDLIPGDKLLLCSDGLSRSLEISDFTPPKPLDALANSLLENALARDGTDNVSLVVLEASARD